MADDVVDAVIVDPPYGACVHDGYKSTADVAAQGLSYSAWTPADVDAFVAAWSPRCRGWMVAMTSHDLIPAWETAYRAAGRYAFQPLPIVMPGMTVRILGDGPSSWAVYAMVARPRTRTMATWGTLPGAYVVRERGGGAGRGKPAQLCQALVRDYTRKGDTIADPCAGWGSTLLAAAALGRSAIGAEVSREVYDVAHAAIGGPQQLGMLL